MNLDEFSMPVTAWLLAQQGITEKQKHPHTAHSSGVVSLLINVKNRAM